MAEALAMMHSYGEIDVNDVKFILAPLPSTAPSATGTVHSTVLEEHAMWLLDFDCCRQISMDGKSIDQAVAVFFENNPLPRPSTRGSPYQALSELFYNKYLQPSSGILGGDSPRPQLPRIFVEKNEEMQRKCEKGTGTSNARHVNKVKV